MEAYFLVGIFLVSIVFRTSYRIIAPHEEKNFDTYFHLYLIEFIRRNGTKELIDKKRFIKPASLNYPWLVHLLLSKTPKEFENLIEKFLNAILDSFFALGLAVFAYYQTTSVGVASIVGVLYIFLPITFSIKSTGPRIATFTPRVIGEISGNIIFILEYLYIVNGNFNYYILAAFLSTFVFMSSKFSSQALFLINVFLSFYTWQFELLLLFFIGMAGAIIISKGRYLSIIRQHYRHLKWYFFLNLKNKMPSSDRNNIKVLINYIRDFNIKKLYYYLIYENTFSILVIKYPIILIVIYLIYTDGILINKYFTIFLLSFVSVFVLISFKFFAFIGEAERYMNYSFYFFLLPISEYCVDNYFIVSLLIIYGLIFYGLDLKELYKKKQYLFNRDDNLINWLKTQPNTLNVATIPFHLGKGRRIPLETKHNWFYPVAWRDQKDKDIANSFISKYPFLDLYKIDDFKIEYNIDYVFINKNQIINEGIDAEYLEKITRFEIDGGILVC